MSNSVVNRVTTLTAASMVLDLLESGHTQHEIAMVCDVHQTTISKLARGDTRDMLGRSYAALMALHHDCFKPSNLYKAIHDKTHA